jgi:hypothetical protein
MIASSLYIVYFILVKSPIASVTIGIVDSEQNERRVDEAIGKFSNAVGEPGLFFYRLIAVPFLDEDAARIAARRAAQVGNFEFIEFPLKQPRGDLNAEGRAALCGSWAVSSAYPDDKTNGILPGRLWNLTLKADGSCLFEQPPVRGTWTYEKEKLDLYFPTTAIWPHWSLRVIATKEGTKLVNDRVPFVLHPDPDWSPKSSQDKSSSRSLPKKLSM